jgi:hypothetical protein
MERLHALKAAALPIPNAFGLFEQADPSDLTSSEEVNSFIRDRVAAWDRHLEQRTAAVNPDQLT